MSMQGYRHDILREKLRFKMQALFNTHYCTTTIELSNILTRRSDRQRQGRWKSHTMLGMIYLNRNDDENALYHFKRALIFNPFDANVHNAIAYIMMKREQYDNAESVVKGAISIDPQNEYSLKMFAWLLHRRGAS
jgi:Tfp pilus assembly protein PilF